jgi:hypothetical protein
LSDDTRRAPREVQEYVRLPGIGQGLASPAIR